jgi:hypothetical protein
MLNFNQRLCVYEFLPKKYIVSHIWRLNKKESQRVSQSRIIKTAGERRIVLHIKQMQKPNPNLMTKLNIIKDVEFTTKGLKKLYNYSQIIENMILL